MKSDLCSIAFVKMFVHKVILLSRTHDNDIYICRPTNEKDTLTNGAGILHYVCVWYRLLTEESARFFCKQATCDMYDFVMTGIIGGFISVIGIACNIDSLIVFRHSVIKTPTTYQLWWLTIVDTIFLVLWFVYVAVFYIINYLYINRDNLYWQVMRPYIQVCMWPVFIIV